MSEKILAKPLTNLFFTASLATGLLLGLFLTLAQITYAAGTEIVVTITTDTVSDEGECSLREAISAANSDTASGGTTGECPAGSDTDPDIITLSSETYLLTRGGSQEDNNVTGDLDITGNLIINGVGDGTTIIDGDTLFDRVLHVQSGANVTLNGLTVTNGRSPSATGGANGIDGGGIYLDTNSSLVISNSLISENRSGKGGTGSSSIPNGGNGGDGGGIFISNSSSLTLTNSTLYSNITGAGGDARSDNNNSDGGDGGDGGGIYLDGNSSLLTLINSTLSGNSTGNGGEPSSIGGNGGGGGDAAALYNLGVIVINHSTLTNNSTGSGGSGGSDGSTGGLEQRNIGNSSVKNSILAGNTAGGGNPDCSDATGSGVASLGYNLVEEAGTCTFANTGDITGTANLSSLADNGGPTPTHAPQATSPVIDAGSCSDITTDQRGSLRPVDMSLRNNADDACDIGAYELQANLAFSKTYDESDTPAPGQRITYTLTMSNSGILSITNVLISDTLPVSLTMAGQATITPTQGGVILATTALSLPTIANNVTLTPGDLITISLPVTLATELSVGTRFTNTAKLFATEATLTSSLIITATSSSTTEDIFLPLIIKEPL